MDNFKRIDRAAGWAVFTVALAVYVLTMEETASYWDCSEFIAVSYKLEVPHPPGAPLFLLLGRLFSLFAFGDTAKVALCLNFMSALASAFTTLFLFWSITLLGRRLARTNAAEPWTSAQRLLLIGAGLTGALAYTFSDSFWFSAVEAEVYAMSSFFTSLVVWGMLEWSLIEDESKANRWLILIAYMMGLSIGVHMLNLVTIPALGLIYYFKKHIPTRWGVAFTLLISVSIVLFINNFIVPGLPGIAASFEIFFVNTLGLPFGSGVTVFCLLIALGLAYGIFHSQRRAMPSLNTALLSLAFILVGYCSYATVVIRSNFNPPINENAPKDVMSFISYLKREQYGSRPLLFGPYYTSKAIDAKPGAPVYRKGKERYEEAERQFDYVYDKETFLPRAWDSSYGDAYQEIMGWSGDRPPTFLQNLSYMFQHQIGTMYARYFLWNFAGRESDEEMADWLGPSSWFAQPPPALAANKARNNFFMIPLLFGLIGAFFHASRDPKGFSIVGLLFVMLGVAIVVYLNSPPVEPRERDYIYTGSMYAFTFWIGLAVIGIAGALHRLLKRATLSAGLALGLALSAPALMAFKGWDDHDRSNRFFSLDSGTNYLVSCAPEAILYTGGDNDTFMLWYAQEVENVRPDIRTLVLSYYNTDWYIDQSMYLANQSPPIKYTLSLYDYRQGGPNDYISVREMGIPSIDLRQYLDLLHRGHPQLVEESRSILPSRVLTLPVDTAYIRSKGIVPKEMEDLMVDKMEFTVTGGGLEKKDLAFLDVLATANWERPIYINYTSASQLKIDLEPYLVKEGNVSRVLPIRNPLANRKDLVDTERSYDNMLHKYRYRGLDNDRLYYSEDYKNFALNHRSSFNMLANALLDKGDTTRAKEVLLFSLEKIPDRVIPYDQTIANTVDMLIRVGERQRAIAIAQRAGARAESIANYLMQTHAGLTTALRRNVYILGELQSVLLKNGEKKLSDGFESSYEKIVTYLQTKGMLGRR